MAEHVASQEIDCAERQLAASWSIGALRPWLKMVAERELPVSLRGRIESSDIVQQTLLDAWRGATSFRGTTPQERLAWLRVIMRRVILQHGRSQFATMKRGGHSERLQSELDRTSSRVMELAAGAAPTPAEQAATNESSLLLAQAIERLPPEEQELIRMRHFEHRTHDEIAQHWGRNPSAIRMQWVRTLRRLRNLLSDPPS
jgi:RNA polymerase sigma-70 factor (ECF subfamily)